MAPTKEKAAEKEAKLTPEQSAALVLDYLRKQNRPYSATDISANLKNRVSKAAAAKLLKDMHERNEIEGRASGKQFVYHTIQEEPEEGDADKLAEMEAETTRLVDTTAALKSEEKDLRVALREGAAQIPLPELKAMVTGLEEQKAEMAARLEKLKGGGFTAVGAEEREKVGSEHRKWMKTAGNRKKIRSKLWGQIEEVIDKDKVEETKEELGLEF